MKDTRFLIKSRITGKDMICEWIEEAARTTHAVVHRLEREAVSRLISVILSRYTNEEREVEYLWEGFVNDVSMHSEDGWRIACEYPTKSPILIFRDGSDYEGFSIDSTDSLFRVLSESPGFEFLLTNIEVDFVLCFNHHDFLIGAGKCTQWLAGLPDKLD